MTRGGVRPGAGRPKGQGRYREATKPLRVPNSLAESVLHFVQNKGYKLPLYASTVSAGTPLPADDQMAGQLDLHELLIKNPDKSFLVRVTGESMRNAGIHHDDILIVDRSLNPANGKVVIAALHGQLTVKRLKTIQGGKVFLMPENEDFDPIEVSSDEGIYIWGVVTNVIHAIS